MKKAYSIIVFAVLILIATGCKKDKDGGRMGIITSGTWKIIALATEPGYDADGDGDIDSDLFALYDACEKDDYFVFRNNGSFEVNEGPTKCDPSNPQVYSSEWQFANNESEIIIDGDRGIIEELTNSTLRIRTESAGEKFTITFGR
jgi:hypothetical protein